MKLPKKPRIMSPSAPYRRSMLLILICFFAGCLLGFAAHLAVSKNGFSELAAYLTDYAKASESASGAKGDLFTVLLVYFRYPLLLFLLGLFSGGKKLIPAICAMEGFFLSFSVGCFASALGRLGVWLALVSFGTRCLFVLPCSFYLAAYGRLSPAGPGRRTGGSAKGAVLPDAVLRFVVCMVVLAIGCFLEVSVVPKLFTWALARIQ